ncbi:hypothetical protein [Trichormus azollae]|uniref:hypothetical protein n=1 Tax=Trichormus azollae TaxID=1164 RepID=UPI00325D5D44
MREVLKYQDFSVCGISTQLKQYISDFDEIVSHGDYDFQFSGLVSPSVIRLGFLTVIGRNNIISSIATERHKQLLHNLS